MSASVKIKKSFGSFVLDVQFEAENEVMALLGASGCGKSMTLKCIAGVVRPDEGRIVIDGRTLFDSEKHIDLSPQKRRVGLLFQNYALFPNMTVKENIIAVLKRSDRKTDCEKDFASLCEKFYIKGLETHYPSQLSGGQQQRVALARIIAADPSMIMLDEPLSALDSYLRWQLEQQLAELFDNFRGTVVYVSHNRDEVYRLCSKVCVVHKGRSEEVRPVKDLFEAPHTLAASLLSGCKNYSRAEVLGDGRVRAIDWNTELRCVGKAENIRYIGVRAHYIKPCADNAENVIKCKVLHVTEDVFSTVATLLPENAPESRGFPQIRMELAKSELSGIRAGEVISIRMAPEDIMLLS
jgi:molybdate transport system ATP-binding protein